MVMLMTSADADHWQIQEAKQRFSEMIRAVTNDGPQVITRHGEDVAVVVDISEYRRLTRPAVDLAGVLLGGPKLDDDGADVFAEIEAERKADFGRPVDLGADG
jgi:prevent-host-death family protein